MKVKLPDLFETTLSNGLKIIISKKADIPLVYIETMVKFGASQDPPDLPGLCDMTVELLCRGSKQLSGAELDSEIDKYGIDFFGQTSYDASFISISGLSEDTQKMLSIMSDILQNPIFSNDELTALKKRRIAQLTERLNTPQIIANENIAKVLYKDHPYGHSIDGTIDSIGKINHHEIERIYKDGYLPNKSILLIVGDIKNEDQIIKECEKSFAGWNPLKSSNTNNTKIKTHNTKIQTDLDNPPHSTGCKIWLINRPELTQAQIRFSHLGIKYKNKDFFAIFLMNYILGGGGFASRLMTEIRSNKGYTYSISSGFIPRLGIGPFKISTHVSNEKVEPLFIDVIKTINKFIKEGPKDQELKEAKDFFLGSFPLGFDTLGKIASKLLSVELYDLGKDFLEKYTEKIAAVGLEDIKYAAAEYLHPENFHVVVVGKSALYIKALDQFGEVLELEY